MIRTELINHIYLKGDANKMKNRILTIIIGFILLCSDGMFPAVQSDRTICIRIFL